MLESSGNFYGIGERRVKEREESIGNWMGSFYEQSGIEEDKIAVFICKLQLDVFIKSLFSGVANYCSLLYLCAIF